MNNLKDKHVVIIGGSSGIGLATAVQANEAGAKVVALGRSEDRLAKARAAHPNIEFTSLDVHDIGGLTAFFADRTVDHIVSAATGAERTMAPFLQQTAEQFSEAFNKFWGYCNVIRAGAPQLAADGSITLVSGVPARKCNPGMSSVSCVGNAVEGLVRALAVELAPQRVNVVAPGLIDTGMWEHFGDKKEQVFEQMSQNVLLKRIGHSDEVASAIILTLNNGYMTGTTLDVDGGQLLP